MLSVRGMQDEILQDYAAALRFPFPAVSHLMN